MLLNDKWENCSFREKKIAIFDPQESSGKQKTGLTQNKPLVATEGEKHQGQRLDMAHEASLEGRRGDGRSWAVGASVGCCRRN